MSSNVLYTVTTVRPWDGRRGDNPLLHKRTPAICTTLERARQIVERNEGDIYETDQMFAVIEAVTPDVLYPSGGGQYWYRWEGGYPDGRYVSCESPEGYRSLSGWGIG